MCYPRLSFDAYDTAGGDRFSAQLTEKGRNDTTLAFGYSFSAAHVNQATSPATFSLNWTDTKKSPYCSYNKSGLALNYGWHWYCNTQSGAVGWVKGTIKYTIPNYQAVVTANFKIQMESWAGG